ncbi:putative serine/threonine-protein kinase [Platanthera zijinensis]|uniref:Serine/threonine-protein kinase n=1 Tax=Platanthera zijinensis TaxID=2320716 RepID=A0AAP0BG31_9ASPA
MRAHPRARPDSDPSLCEDYSLYYSTHYGKRDLAALPGYCSNSGDLWFQWKLSFGGDRNGGETSLLVPGFLPGWLNHQDCFSSEFAASGNCSGVAGDRSCSTPQGTPGYLDPEYHRSYQLTDRSDVHCFGVVLAKVLSSKPAVDLRQERAEINLSALAVSKIQSEKWDELVDWKMAYDRRTTRLVAELAFRCLEADREMRLAIRGVRGAERVIKWGVLVF